MPTHLVREVETIKHQSYRSIHWKGKRITYYFVVGDSERRFTVVGRIQKIKDEENDWEPPMQKWKNP